MYSNDTGRAIWQSLVNGTRKLDDMTTDQIADLCRWNDVNGDWDKTDDETNEEYRAALIQIVRDWLIDSRD